MLPMVAFPAEKFWSFGVCRNHAPSATSRVLAANWSFSSTLRKLLGSATIFGRGVGLRKWLSALGCI